MAQYSNKSTPLNDMQGHHDQKETRHLPVIEKANCFGMIPAR
jgi:hypothetical protein